jgi:hypothetical protein
MNPPLLAIFENIQYLCQKRKEKKNIYSVLENILLKQEWRKINLSDGVSNLKPTCLQSDALPTELAGHRILIVDDRYITKTFTCTHFHNIFKAILVVLIS